MLNEKESKLFDAIVKYIDENGYSPSVRELSEFVGFKSTSTVHRYLSKLEEKGYIERRENSPGIEGGGSDLKKGPYVGPFF